MTDKCIKEIQEQKGRNGFSTNFILKFDKEWNAVVKKFKRRSILK